MTVQRIPAGAIILTGHDLDAVAYALHLAQKYRRMNGQTHSRQLAELLTIVSADSQSDSPEPSPEQSGHVMSTDQVAELLSQSPRTVTRQAERLGGTKVGGRWVFDPQTIREHHEGTTR